MALVDIDIEYLISTIKAKFSLPKNKGNNKKGVYTDENGVLQECLYSVEKSVPSNAVFTDTTYNAGSGLSLNGTTINHDSSIDAGTIGTSSSTSGKTINVPYITVNATGHVVDGGVHEHTIPTSKYFHVSTYTSGQISAYDLQTTIYFSAPEGYTICPITCRTNGWVGSPYIGGWNYTSCTIYWTHNGAGTVSVDVLWYKDV